jgi:uncharacterized RDD family membrane protein YckC
LRQGPGILTSDKPNCSQCDTPRRPDDLRCRYCGAPFVAAPLMEVDGQPVAHRPAVERRETLAAETAPGASAAGSDKPLSASAPVTGGRPTVTPDPGGAAAGRAVRPWVRYWARVIDLYVFGAVVTALIDYSNLGLLGSPGAQKTSSLLALVAWMLIEARLLQQLGTTPGKLLLNVRVWRRDGGAVTLRDTLLRSLRLWWRGLGAGLPVVSFITAYLAYRQLRDRGETSWDRDGGWEVVHGEIGPLRVLATIVTVVATFAMSVVVRIGA